MNIEKGIQEETLQGKLKRKRPENKSPGDKRRQYTSTPKDMFHIQNVSLWPAPKRSK